MTASTFPRWPGDTVPPFVFLLCRELTKYFTVHALVPHCDGALESETMDGVHVTRYRYAPRALERLAYTGGMLNILRAEPWLLLVLPLFLIGQWRAVRRLHEANGYASINAHWIVPQGLVSRLGALDVPLVMTSHGGDLYSLNSRPARAMKSWILKGAARLSVVSEAMIEECDRLGVAPSKTVVRSMGVDTRTLFTPPAESARRESGSLLFVGRMVDKKGVHVLIDAAAILLESGASFTLTLIGDGPERASLEERARSAGLSNEVRFLGSLANVALVEHYRRARLFVLPSVIASTGDREGLGLVTVEAMSCGCCVVAADLPAVHDVIEPDVDGVMFRAGDSEDLADRLLSLLQDDERAARLSRNAIASARKFDWEKVGEDYRDLILDVIDGR